MANLGVINKYSVLHELPKSANTTDAKNCLSQYLKEPSNIEFLMSTIGSLLYISFSGISLSSILFGNQDGQQTKHTLLCISNELKGTPQK